MPTSSTPTKRPAALRARKASSTSDTANTANIWKMAFIAPRSAKRPPITLPVVMPIPSVTSTNGTNASGLPRVLGHEWSHVGVHGEETAEAERSRGQRKPHGGALEGPQLATHGRVSVGLAAGNEGENGEGCEREDRRDREVGDAPRRVLTKVGNGGHANNVRDREPGEHEGDGPASLCGTHELGGRERGNAEVRAVRQAGEEPEGDRPLERRRQR